MPAANLCRYSVRPSPDRRRAHQTALTAPKTVRSSDRENAYPENESVWLTTAPNRIRRAEHPVRGCTQTA